MGKSKKPSMRIKRVCIRKIKTGKNRGQCAKKGYQVGDSTKKQFALKKNAIKAQSVMKRRQNKK